MTTTDTTPTSWIAPTPTPPSPWSDAPSWLRLEEILPAEVVDLHAEVFASLSDLAPTLLELAGRARAAFELVRLANAEASAQLDDSTSDFADGLRSYLAAISGDTRTWQLLQNLSELLHPETLVGDGTPFDVVMKDLFETLGVPSPEIAAEPTD